jgi:hypothetical protein
MTTLPQMGLVLPTRGAPGSGLWADAIDAMMALIDAHTHQTGSGALIRPAAIGINGDLTFAGNGATNLGKAAFTAVTALAAGSKTLFVSSSDNELYWRSNGGTNGGTNVKLTSGSTLNVAGFAGGIGGDYTGVSAALNYDDANTRYTMKQGGGTTWARIASGDLRLHETGTSESFYVGIAAPAALAGAYTITLPTAAPGSTQLVQMAASGQMSFSNTVTNLITASAGVTCTADQHVTVSGTGRFKHGSQILHVSPIVGSGSNWAWSSSNGYLASSGAGTWSVGIPTIVGWRLTAVTFEVFGDGSADLTGDVFRRPKNSTPDASKFGISVTNPPASWNDEVCNITDIDVADGDSVWINFTASAANLRIGEIRVTYTFP